MLDQIDNAVKLTDISGEGIYLDRISVLRSDRTIVFITIVIGYQIEEGRVTAVIGDGEQIVGN